MLALSEKQTLIRALGQVIADKVRDELAPFRKMLADLEIKIATLPEPKDGKDGKDFDPSALNDAILDQLNTQRANGLIVDFDAVTTSARSFVADAQIEMQKWTAAYITEQFEKCLPKVRDGIDGKDGKNGIDGKDGEVDIEKMNHTIFYAIERNMEAAASQLKKFVEELPKPEKGEKGEKGDKGDPGEPGKDGRNGTNGTDGKSVSLDELRSAIADLVIKAIGDISLPRSVVGGFVNRDGRLHLTFSDGSSSDLGEIVGHDGRDCDMEMVKSQVAAYLASIEKPKDGKDGLGFDDLQLEFDGERLVQLKFIRGEEAKIFDLDFPVPLFKDIWKEGDYKRGHIVVRDGSMWIAQRNTSSVPGSPESDWKLCTKRGRDGKDGKAGLKGEKGDPGKPGRDLTQIGQDGAKW